MRRLMTNWMNDDPWVMGVLEPFLLLLCYSVDWSSSGMALTNKPLLAANLHERLVWGQHTARTVHVPDAREHGNHLHTSHRSSDGPSLRSSRRVAFASLIGTTIEWYDFFIFGTAAALIFNEVFFPSFDPVTGTLAAFASFSVGFIAQALRRRRLRPLRRQDRPQADAGLLAAAHGRGDGADGPAARLRLDRHLGTDSARRAALRSGLRRRRRVGWCGADGRRARSRASARLLRCLAPSRRAGRPRPGNGYVRPAVGNADRRAVPRVGMAGSVPGQRAAHRRRHVDPAHRGREPDLSEDTRCEVGREDASARRSQDLPEGDRAGRRIVRGHPRHVLRRIGLADLLRDDRRWVTTAPPSSTPTRL